MYEGMTFFEVLGQLLTRIPSMLMGSPLASDELQFLVLNLIALTAALVGTLSVVRRYTMMANALSHTLLIGIVGVFLFSQVNSDYAPLSSFQLALAALFGAGLTAWMVHFFTTYAGIKEDAGIGAAFSFLFALGVLLLSVISRNAHIGVELLVGNADGLVEEDLMPAIFSALLALVMFTLFFRGWKITSFDPVFANLAGFSPGRYGALLLLIQAFCVVVAFRSVGVIMVLGLLCLPALIARLYCTSFGSMSAVASCIALVVTTSAIALSRHLVSVYSIALSTGALAIVLLALVYLFACCFKNCKKLN